MAGGPDLVGLPFALLTCAALLAITIVLIQRLGSSSTIVVRPDPPPSSSALPAPGMPAGGN